ncbi:MAG: hypothetical protein ACRDJO_13475 [Actinomycetota bacterium]
MTREGERALTALGVVRLTVGMVALLAPRRYAKVLEVDPEDRGAIDYIVRLFGIRTVFLGLDLLCSEQRAVSAHHAVFIHAFDAAAAVAGGLTGQIPPRAAATGTALSGLNTVLAIRGRRAAP